MGACAMVKQCNNPTVIILNEDIPNTNSNQRLRKYNSRAKTGKNNKTDLALDKTEEFNLFYTMANNSSKKKKVQKKTNKIFFTPEERIPKPRLTSKYIYEASLNTEHNKKLADSRVKVLDLSIEQEIFIAKVLTENNIVSELDDDTMQEFVIGFFSIEITANYTIFRENDEAKVFYIVEKGSFKLESSDPENERICFKGDFFGLEAFEENSNRIQSAISLENSKLLCVNEEFYKNALAYMELMQIKEKIEIIKKLSLFKNIEQYKQIKLCKHLAQVIYKPNSIVINENEGQDRIGIIQSGMVRVTRKFKKVTSLEAGDFFCQIGLFMKLPCYYTYSVDKEELVQYELLYSDIKEALGNNYIKDILFEIFKKSLQSSERINTILYEHQNELFGIFKLIYYEKGAIVFSTDPKNNKKICVVISGQLSKSQKKDSLVAKVGDLFGQEIVDSKQNIDCNIISDEETLILEASWDEIVRESEKYTTNKINLAETVTKLKKIPIFSTLKETQYFELAKSITVKSFQDEEIISREGEIADKFYIIKSGKVKMYQKRVFIRNLDVGGCFGEIPNVTGEIRLFTVISIGNTECYVLTKEDFSAFDFQLTMKIKNFSSLNNINISLRDLFFVKTLGNGRFGKVFLVHNQKHFYAIKYSRIKRICQSKELMQYYLNEKNIMLQLDHPFVVKLVKTLKDEDNLYFLLEYIDGIPLKTYLEKKRKNKVKNLLEPEFYGGILLNTVNYLHSKKILHRDIKPDNCMIDKNGYLKLIDFGIAKELKNQDMTSTICGTPHYLAPEVILGKGYSYSSDSWSIGVTMFEIFYGYVPFGQSAKDAMAIYYDIINKKLKLPYDPKFNDINSFFNIILSKNQLHRVCNYQLLKSHPFFHQFDFEQLTTFTITPPYIPDSYIEHNSTSNNNIISTCSISMTNYMKDQKSPYDDGSLEMEYSQSQIDFIDEF